MASRLTPRDQLLRSISEATWQRTVIDAAHAFGWRVYATNRSGRRLPDGTSVTFIEADGKGYPDLTCVQPATGRKVFIENKTETGRVTPEQDEWLNWLSDRPRSRCYVLRPSDQGRLEEIFG